MFNLSPEEVQALQNKLVELISNHYPKVEKASIEAEVKNSWGDYWLLRGYLEGFTGCPEIALIVHGLLLVC